jgi:hypothetical protein
VHTCCLGLLKGLSEIDQLIQIALKRRDLGDDGKEALLGALEEYGVDVSGPPFSLLLCRDGATLRTSLPKLLDKGEDGFVCFVEDVLFYPQETRLSLIRELPSVADARVLDLLEILLGCDREIRLKSWLPPAQERVWCRGHSARSRDDGDEP